MEQVTVSSKYQIVIPKSIRNECKIKPGQKIILYNNNGYIQILPEMNLDSLFGSLKGEVHQIERYEDRL